MREICLMRKLNEINNEHILRFIDAYYDEDTTTIVVSKLGEEVFARLTKESMGKSGQIFSEQDAFDILYQITDAVEAMHKNNVCHFDIKLENINYLTDDPTCKTICLIDMGMTRESEKWPLEMEKQIGTAAYLPPECLLPPHVYGPATDVFSMGVLLYTLILGNYPFEPRNLRKSRFKAIPSSVAISKNCIDIIARMLDPDMNRRITISSMRDHPWFTNVPDHLGTNIMHKDYFTMARRRTLSRLLSAYEDENLTPERWERLRDTFHGLATGKMTLKSAERVVASDVPLKHVEIDFDNFVVLMEQIGLGRFALPHVFALFDRDGNGTIDFREFVQSLIALRGKSELSHRYIFQLFDTDRNGQISYEEFRHIFWGVYTSDIAEDMKECFGYIPSQDDVNKEQDEFLKRQFDKIDTDDSRSICFEEFSAWYTTAEAQSMFKRTFSKPVGTSLSEA